MPIRIKSENVEATYAYDILRKVTELKQFGFYEDFIAEVICIRMCKLECEQRLEDTELSAS